MVEHEHIQISIEVIIKKSSLCRKSDKVESIFDSTILECRNAVGVVTFIDQQQVSTLIDQIITKIADIDIQPSVAVHIGHGYAGGPPIEASSTRHICYICKLKVA